MFLNKNKKTDTLQQLEKIQINMFNEQGKCQ